MTGDPGIRRLGFLILVLIALGHSAAEEKDFEFAESFKDDEDFLGDEAGSGDIEGSGEFPGPTGQPALYRAVLNFTSLSYTAEIAAAGRDIGSLAETQAIQLALERLFATLPGTVRIRIVSLQRGSLMVTFDIDTDGAQTEQEIKDLLQEILQSGSLNGYTVSPAGYDFKRIRSTYVCPPAVGRIPSSLPTLRPQDAGISADLMINNAFPCTGYIVSWNIYRASATGTAFIGVFRQTSDLEFMLISATEVPEASVGGQSILLRQPILAQKGDFVGVFYGRRGQGGVIAKSTEADRFVADAELFQNYLLAVYEEDLEEKVPFSINDYSNYEIRTTYAIQAEMSYIGVPEPTLPPVTVCSADEFTCSNGDCVSGDYKCDGQRDCYDGSDEEGCPAQSCAADEVQCGNTRQCIPVDFVCNGVNDCGDNWDEEQNCFVRNPDTVQISSYRDSTSFDSFLVTWTRPFDGGSQIVSYIVRWRLVYVRPDLRDNRYVLQNPRSEFIEAQLPGTAESYQLSNLQADSFYEVEIYANNVRGASQPEAFIFKTARAACAADQWQCANGGCVQATGYCDGFPDCSDDSDEPVGCNRLPVCVEGLVACQQPDGTTLCVEVGVGCAVVCRETEFQCLDGKKCISFLSLCDRRQDCDDNSDENNCDCAAGEFKCANGRQCIEGSKRCDNKNDCDDNSDENNCPCQGGSFQCLNTDKQECVDQSLVCDGVRDCEDGSDEASCGCRADQWQCMDRSCIPESMRCDNVPQCEDQSDEDNCVVTCRPDQYTCADGNCVEGRMRCDGIPQCEDASDEVGCIVTCRPDQYTCADGNCVEGRMHCDGIPQCEDASDEVGCIVTCRPDQYTCADGNCVEGRMRCDGIPQCEDSSDEDGCIVTCRPDQYTCADGNCVEGRMHCDGIPQCEDASDEVGCIVTCRPDQYTCADGNCVEGRMHCDGIPQCEDASDEVGCIVTCRPDQFTCADGSCIEGRQYCDGTTQCADRSDEFDCECAEGMFTCADGNCVEGYMRCDGRPQCEDSSDENGCPAQNCPVGDFQCRTGTTLECIDIRLKCDGYPDCSDNSDEEDCPGCRPGEFTCVSDGRCLPAWTRCNGRVECTDRSDELSCPCTDDQFRCGDGLCIDISRRCDRRDDCADRSDELACPCRQGEFQCVNGDCIDERRRCNQQVDCSDGSDEQNCPSTQRCREGYVQCGTGHCLSESRWCDGYPDCPDQSDERNCSLRCAAGEMECEVDNKCIPVEQICNRVYDCSDGRDELANCRRCNTQDEFECESDKSCISLAGRCNGVKECSDGSDEMGCPTRPPISVVVGPKNLRIRAGAEAILTCFGEGLPRGASLEWLRSNDKLPMQSAVEGNKLMIPVAKPMDSGTYICRVNGVPGDFRDFATLEVVQIGPPEPDGDNRTCSRDEAVCQNGQCIRREYRCDGEKDCDDGSDEPPDCRQNLCEPNEFQCPNGQCVMKIWRCDGEDDCNDGYDEKNCESAPPGSPCAHDEFQCVSGEQCVPLAYQCDAEIDCLDRSDEIGCSPPIITVPPVAEIEVELGSTFTIICEAVGVPTPLIVWRLNWGNIPTGKRVTVTSSEGRGQLVIEDAQYTDAGAYTCEAINNRGSIFAIPDALVIVRLIITGGPDKSGIKTTKVLMIGGSSSVDYNVELNKVLVGFNSVCTTDLQMAVLGTSLYNQCPSSSIEIEMAYLASKAVDFEIARKIVLVERRGDTLPEEVRDIVVVHLGGLPQEIKKEDINIVRGSVADESVIKRQIELAGRNINKYSLEKQIINIGVNYVCKGEIEIIKEHNKRVLVCKENITDVIISGRPGGTEHTEVVVTGQSREDNKQTEILITGHTKGEQSNIQETVKVETVITGEAPALEYAALEEGHFSNIEGQILEIDNIDHVKAWNLEKSVEIGSKFVCDTKLDVKVIGSNIVCRCRENVTHIKYIGRGATDLEILRETIFIEGKTDWSHYQEQDFVIIYMGGIPKHLKQVKGKTVQVIGLTADRVDTKENVIDIFKQSPQYKNKNQRQTILIGLSRHCDQNLVALRDNGKHIIECIGQTEGRVTVTEKVIDNTEDISEHKVIAGDSSSTEETVLSKDADLKPEIHTQAGTWEYEKIFVITGSSDVNIKVEKMLLEQSFCSRSVVDVLSNGKQVIVDCRVPGGNLEISYVRQGPAELFLKKRTLDINDFQWGTRKILNNSLVVYTGNHVRSHFEHHRGVEYFRNIDNGLGAMKSILKIHTSPENSAPNVVTVIELGYTVHCDGILEKREDIEGISVYCKRHIANIKSSTESEIIRDTEKLKSITVVGHSPVRPNITQTIKTAVQNPNTNEKENNKNDVKISVNGAVQNAIGTVEIDLKDVNKTVGKEASQEVRPIIITPNEDNKNIRQEKVLNQTFVVSETIEQETIKVDRLDLFGLQEKVISNEKPKTNIEKSSTPVKQSVLDLHGLVEKLPTDTRQNETKSSKNVPGSKEKIIPDMTQERQEDKISNFNVFPVTNISIDVKVEVDNLNKDIKVDRFDLFATMEQTDSRHTDSNTELVENKAIINKEGTHISIDNSRKVDRMFLFGHVEYIKLNDSQQTIELGLKSRCLNGYALNVDHRGFDVHCSSKAPKLQVEYIKRLDTEIGIKTIVRKEKVSKSGENEDKVILHLGGWESIANVSRDLFEVFYVNSTLRGTESSKEVFNINGLTDAVTEEEFINVIDIGIMRPCQDGTLEKYKDDDGEMVYCSRRSDILPEDNYNTEFNSEIKSRKDEMLTETDNDSLDRSTYNTPKRPAIAFVDTPETSTNLDRTTYYTPKSPAEAFVDTPETSTNLDRTTYNTPKRPAVAYVDTPETNTKETSTKTIRRGDTPIDVYDDNKEDTNLLPVSQSVFSGVKNRANGGVDKPVNAPSGHTIGRTDSFHGEFEETYADPLVADANNVAEMPGLSGSSGLSGVYTLEEKEQYEDIVNVTETHRRGDIKIDHAFKHIKGEGVIDKPVNEPSDHQIGGTDSIHGEHKETKADPLAVDTNNGEESSGLKGGSGLIGSSGLSGVYTLEEKNKYDDIVNVTWTDLGDTLRRGDIEIDQAFKDTSEDVRTTSHKSESITSNSSRLVDTFNETNSNRTASTRNIPVRRVNIEINKTIEMDIGNDCKGKIETVQMDDTVMIKCTVGGETLELKLIGLGPAKDKESKTYYVLNDDPSAYQDIPHSRTNRFVTDFIGERKRVVQGPENDTGTLMTIHEVYYASRMRYLNETDKKVSDVRNVVFVDHSVDNSKHDQTSNLHVKAKVKRGDILPEYGVEYDNHKYSYTDIDDLKIVHDSIDNPNKDTNKDLRKVRQERSIPQIHVRSDRSSLQSASNNKPRKYSHERLLETNMESGTIDGIFDDLTIAGFQRVLNVRNTRALSEHGEVNKRVRHQGRLHLKGKGYSRIQTMSGKSKLVKLHRRKSKQKRKRQGKSTRPLHAEVNKHSPETINVQAIQNDEQAQDISTVEHILKVDVNPMKKAGVGRINHFGDLGIENSQKTYTLQGAQTKDHSGLSLGRLAYLTNSKEGAKTLDITAGVNTGSESRLSGFQFGSNIDLDRRNVAGGNGCTTEALKGKEIVSSRVMDTQDRYGSVRYGVTIVKVVDQKGPCNPPFFNLGAVRSDECVRCFCFGQSLQCFSSDLHVSRIALANDVTFVRRVSGELVPADQKYVNFKPNTREYQVDDMVRALPQGKYYWSLPREFLGERLTSYGGELKYTIFYDILGRQAPIEGADVIINGNGRTLYYKGKTLPSPGVPTSVSVPLIESAWERTEGAMRGDTPVSQYADREDLMTVLEDLQYVLIRGSYDRGQEISRIGGLFMTTTVNYETEYGLAYLVEDCVCPTGYTGRSCQECASGFTRVQTGGYLGECISCNCNGHSNDCDPFTGQCLNCQHNTEGPQCQICQDGYYGDARRGTVYDCTPCPCPLTVPSNQFSRTCYLETDGEVTCGNCPPGYEGRRCERCAQGYTGDPMRPGSICKENKVDDYCDDRGSTSPQPNPFTRRCQCKENVQGNLCDSCKESTFYLSSDYQPGCVRCFCMGVSKTCQSTSYNRAAVGTSFTLDNADFTITDMNGNDLDDQRFRVDSNNRELMYRLNAASSEPLYWSLPQQYLGDKVTAYGGYLRFTVRYTSRQSAAIQQTEPIVRLSGNDITLIHRSPQTVSANRPNPFSVQMYEQNWIRQDGQPATREHLLMALADLKSIQIRASYEEAQGDTGLRDVTLDIAEDRTTRQDRAYAVEQCVCPVGYRGLSCEDCDTGYTRSGGGLYLGLCEPCRCNGHSSECDPETGRCKNCQHNTDGDNCERCAVGYYGDASRGTRSDCQKCPCPLTDSPNQFSPACKLDRDSQVTCTACPAGHTGRKCETCIAGYTGNPLKIGDYCRPVSGPDCDCDTRGTVANTQCDEASQQCQCKPYVQGLRCARCREGHFYLEANSPQGCLTCFCSGITNQCTSSSYYREAIRPQIGTDGTHNFVLMNRRMNNLISDGFVVDAARNQVTYNRFDGVQRERESLFFQLPAKFRGDQVASYGGYLRFTLEYTAAPGGRAYRDVDLEIISQGQSLRLYHLFEPALQEGKTQTYEIMLRESSFSYLNSAPTRETFMTILSDIEGFLIRATYDQQMTSVTLRDVSMDTAIPTATTLGGAPMVEDCRCPAGYTGLSCQRCAQGYLRVSDGRGGLGRCVRCNCNNHASACDPDSGRCLECQHNTDGDRCERCAAGFYGDATSGTPNDCRPCPCPLTSPSNQFSTTCFLDTDNQVTCDKCPTGYTGRNCERCDTGYVGSPSQPGDNCRPGKDYERPNVTVTPVRVEEPEGSTVVFQCYVDAQGSQNVVWSRLDSRRLPDDRAYTSPTYDLRITNLRREDSGRYACTATNAYGVSRGVVELKVNAGESPIQVRVDQPRVEVDEGSTVRITCTATSNSRDRMYILSWSKQLGQMPTRALDQNGVLVIPNVLERDAGNYVCTGSDLYNTDKAVVTLIVNAGPEPAPTVRIEPRYQTVDEGSRVRFECIASGVPTPTIRWRRGGNRELNPQATVTTDGVLMIPRATLEDESDYYCEASNEAGTTEVRTILYVTKVEKPEITVIVRKSAVFVDVGDTARLECYAEDGSGRITLYWSRASGLPPGSVQENGVLTIPNVQPNYAGNYVCSGTDTDTGRISTAVTVLEVKVEPSNIPPTAAVEPEKITIPMGTTGTLRCITTGKPEPKVTWTKSRTELSANHQVTGNVLRITNAMMADRGLYVCRAENVAGADQDWAIVEVERRMKPKIDIYPNVTQRVTVGGSALFQCRVMDGDPAPTVQWSRVGGQPLRSDKVEVMDNGVIMFKTVTQAEQGGYICTATNEMGSVSATVTLLVAGPPTITLQPSKVVYAIVGQRVTLECTADGDPTPSVFWIQPSQPRRADVEPDVAGASPDATSGSAVLDIASVERTDEGYYTCVARNSGGRTEDNVQLLIRESGDQNVGVSITGPSTVSAVEGQDLELICTANAIRNPQIRWSRRQGVLPPGHSQRNGILNLPRFQSEYQGEYICTTRTTAATYEASVFIIVTVAPQLTIAPQSITSRAGDTVQLRCSASGSGPFNIEWSKVEGQMNPRATERDGVLEIRQVTAADAGRYRCVAENNVGSSVGYAIVTVEVPPTINMGLRETVAQPGRNAELRCDVTGSPQPTIRWVKENGELPAQHRVQNGVLTIYNVQPEDQGRYICTATSTAGTARDYGVLYVRDDSISVPDGNTDTQVVNVGDRVSMECIVTGTPLPTITWSRDDGPLPQDAILGDGILIIPQAKIQDAGTYTCLAVNEAGSISSKVVLYVRAQPLIQAPQATRAALGESVSLICDATGFPSPEITWFRKDGEMPHDYTIVDGDLLISRVRPEDAGTYVCHAKNDHGTTDTPVSLNVGALVPHFKQNPKSYMAFAPLGDAFHEFDLLLSLRPESTEGMILYNGQYEDGGGDFVCFGLKEGFPEFRFDVGSGPAVIRGDAKLDLNKWHTIKLMRNKKKGTMVVNDNAQFTGESPGYFTGLDLQQNMYLGGVPDYNGIPTVANFKEGFVGSISEVKVKDIDLNLGADALEIVGVESYNACQNGPCTNGGTCVSANTKYGFKCMCPQGYTGMRCEDIGERCYEGACGKNGRCYNLEGQTGLGCICQFGKTGAGCLADVLVINPFFNKTSFISYPPPEDALFSLNVYVEFKPRSLSDGIILYEGNNKEGSKDFMALVLKDGYVEFRFDTGSGPAVVRSRYPVRANEWIRVKASRKNRDGTLIVNDEEPVTDRIWDYQNDRGYNAPESSFYNYYNHKIRRYRRGASEGSTIGLNLKLPLYLGGPDPTYPVASGVGVTKGFVGCVAELQINDRKINLEEDALEFHNVVDCGERRLCERQPCKNYAVCEDLPGPDYRCLCDASHTGKNCDTEINICLTNSPCRNGAPCSMTNDGYRCDCPLGYAGTDCENAINLGTQMSFQGDSFIEFSKDLLPHSNTQQRQTLTFNIRTGIADGLILWQGEPGGRALRGGDHFAIGIKGGYIEYSYEMGSGPAVLMSRKRIDDNATHTISVERLGRSGSLTVDKDQTVYGDSQGFLQMLNADGNIFIGGVSIPAAMTDSKYSDNFVGCIENIIIHGKGPLQPVDAIQGYNVEVCSP